MAYEFKKLGRQKVRYNDDNDDNALVYQLVVDGAKVTPTSATIAVYKPGSSTAVLAATAMTASGSLLTYTLDTTTTANFPVDTGFRADIVVTYNSKTYERQLVFDVVGYLLDLSIGYDQLVGFDDGLQGMEWNGDNDFSEVVNTFRDVIQTRIEAKVLNDGALLENMILDSSRVAVVARYGILGHIWRAKGDPDKADHYDDKYDRMLESVLSTIKYDTSQDGEEGAELGGIQEIRLVT